MWENEGQTDCHDPGGENRRWSPGIVVGMFCGGLIQTVTGKFVCEWEFLPTVVSRFLRE